MNCNPRTLGRQSVLVAITWLLLILGFRAEASGRIVVAFDDWTLADIGFRSTTQPAHFATNVADWFMGGRPGRLLAYSTHPGFTGSSLSNAMASAGHSWTSTTNTSFTLTNLLTFDAVFVGGDAVDTNTLAQYVEAGGNVYVFSGGVAANAQWEGFVGHFGLGFSGTTSGSFEYPISGDHPILTLVDHLYALNGPGDGSTVVDLDPGDPRNAVVASYQGSGLLAVWDDGLLEAPVLSTRIAAVQGDEVAELEVSWTSRTGRQYQVQFSALFPTTGWSDLGTPVSGLGSRTAVKVVPGQSQRYYRVILLP